MTAFYEETPENAAALARLKSAFPDPKRGTLLPWASIEAAIGRHRDDRGGRALIAKFRKWLRREHRIVTLPQTDVGLRLLTHKEAATEIPEYRQARAFRQVNRGLREAAAVDPNQLPDSLRRAFFQQRQNMQEERRTIQRSRRYADAVAQPSETVPRRKPR